MDRATEHEEGRVERPPPWEEIEAGRYQPRRIKGSCLGRELGWTFFVPPGPGDNAEPEAPARQANQSPA